MKRMLFTALLILLFVAVSLFWEGHVITHTRQMNELVDEAMQAITKNGDFATGVEKVSQLEQNWQHVREHWGTLIAHQKLSDIEILLAKAQQAIQDQSAVEAMMHLAALKLSLDHLEDAHTLSMRNLL